MNFLSYAFFTALVVLIGCDSRLEKPEDNLHGEEWKAGKVEVCPKSGICKISLVGVIAQPSILDGREIRVTGYLAPAGDRTRLYLDEESARYAIADRSVLLKYSAEYPNTKRIFTGPPRYVSVSGAFASGTLNKGGLHDNFEEAGTLTPFFPASSIERPKSSNK